MSTQPDQADQVELVRQARELYACEELEIDDDAQLSEANDGTWVQAWVWVPALNGAEHGIQVE